MSSKIENLPFLQNKLKALEAILKKKKIGKLSSFEKVEDPTEFAIKLIENKKKDDSEVNIALKNFEL